MRASLRVGLATILATALLAATPVFALGAIPRRAASVSKPALHAQPTTRRVAMQSRFTRAFTSSSAFKFTAEALRVGSVLDWKWQNPLPLGVGLSDVYFADALTGWVNTDGRMLKTTDGGATWVHQNVGDYFGGGQFAFLDAQHGWCTSDFSVMRTQDGGASWQEFDVLTPDAQGMITSTEFSSISFPDANTGYIVESGMSVRKSTNGGATWSSLPGLKKEYPVAADFVDANTGWLVGDQNYVLKTTNGGATWSQQPVPTTDTYTSLYSVDFVSPSVGWVSGYDGLFKTTNGGATWNLQALPVTDGEVGAIHFTDSSHGWVVVNTQQQDFPWDRTQSILRTEDGGAHWTQVAIGANSDVRSFSFSDTDHGWAVGTGGPLGCLMLKTADSGKTWSSETTGYGATLYDVSSPTTSTVFASGENGTLLRTLDGGATWAARDSETTQTLWALASAGASETWVVGTNGTILHTADKGDTWQSQVSGTTKWLGDLSFIDAQTGWTSGGEGTILKTSDGGGHWAPIPAPSTDDMYRIQFVDQLHGWVGTSGAQGLFKTSNGGASWTAVTPPFFSADSIENLAFADANNGWVTSGDEFAHTTDGGVTWTHQYARAGNYIRSIKAIDASTAVAVTDQGAIVRTNDGGRGWWMQFPPGGALNDVDFADGSTGWVVGTTGLIAKTENGGGTAPAPSRVTGTVRSAVNNAPIAGAAVQIETYPVVYTDAAGNYEVPGMMPGLYENSSAYKLGFLESIEPYVLLGDDDHEVLDFSLWVRTRASVTSARSVRGKLVLRGAITPKHKAKVTLQIDRKIGKGYYRKYNVTVYTNSKGALSYSRKLAKGTWRVRIRHLAAKGYGYTVSAWKTVKIK